MTSSILETGPKSGCKTRLPLPVAILASCVAALSLAGQSTAPTPAPSQLAGPAITGSAAVSGSAAAAKTSAADKRKAHEAYEKGLHAEQANDWENAFQSYREAAVESPADRDVLFHEQLARSQVVQLRTHEAEREILAGQTAQAHASLQAALGLDPSYDVARERLAQLEEDTHAPAQPEIDVDDGPRFASGPPKLLAQSGQRNFTFDGTTRGAYQEIAKQFGLIAAFDGDLIDRQIRFHVSGVDFTTAMRILGEQTGTFWRSLDPHSFFVAADTVQKRKDYAPEVKLTIPLSSSETPDEMTETMRMIRDIVGIVRTDLDIPTHTLTVRDTLENVALAEALVKQVQQPLGELMLEIDVLEVDRQAALNLGIVPPTSATLYTLSSADINQLEQAPNIGSVIQVIESIFGTGNGLSGATSSLSSVIPPLIAFGGGKTIFLATLPGASANFAQSLSAVRQAQRILLRVEDGRPATFFVGERYPITLALLSNSLGSASSQFNSGASASSFPRTDYSVGASPRGVALGAFDTNANSSLDIAAVNQAGNDVSILLNDGTGTFGTQTTYATGNSPVAIASGTFDLMNNGNLDLAVVNQTDNTVSILLGNGDGTFTKQPTDIPVGTGPVAIVAGNFNTNSDTNNYPDLAVVNQTANTVSILLGNGDGTFTKMPTDIAVGNGPIAIAEGEFDSVNNTNEDLAVVNETDDSVSFFLGNGDGTFTAESGAIQVGHSPTGIVAGSFDTANATNNFLGFAVTNGADGTVSILLGNGEGQFSSPSTGTLSTETNPLAILSADFNGDGIPDLAVANAGSDSVSVFLGLGTGAFESPLTIATGNSPVAMAAGDVTGAGLTDLAVANESSNTVSVIQNSSSALSSLLTPNAALSPYPASEYVDLGLKVQATSRMHPDGEATLNLQMDINSLSGQNVNGIPILSNRTVQQSVRLKENETSVLAGLMESTDLRSLSGLPWLADAGPLGYLAGSHNNQQSDTELVIAITPRQVRLPIHKDETIYAGRGQGSAPPPAAALPPPGVAAPPGQPLVPNPGAPAPGVPAPIPAATPPVTPNPGQPSENPGQPAQQPPAQGAPPTTPGDQTPGAPPALPQPEQ
jgi:type II secretory pathway component GspD/PulD (secretin)